MKILVKIIVVLIALIAIVFVVSLFLPKERHVERSIAIDAKPSTVFAIVNDMSRVKEWSSWALIDTLAEEILEGPKTGLGAKRSWSSDNWQVGKGSQWIVESIPNKLVKLNLSFDGDSGVPEATTELSKEGEGTLVKYAFDTKLEGTINVLFGLFMESMVGSAYEESLQNLKRIAEKEPEYSIDFTIEEVAPIKYIGAIKEANPKDYEQISRLYTEAFTEIMISVGDPSRINGKAMALNYEYSPEKMVFEPALPVSEDIDGLAEGVRMASTIGGKVLKAVHFGDYPQLFQTYKEINRYINDQGLKIKGANWEVYTVDSSIESDTAKWETSIYFPVE